MLLAVCAFETNRPWEACHSKDGQPAEFMTLASLMGRLSKVNRADWNLMKVEPSPDFSPEHNKEVIEETIKENDVRRAKLDKEDTEGIRERSAALATYLEHLQMGGASMDMMKYFGKRELGRLRGEQLIRRLQDPLIVRDATGRIIRGPGDAEAHQ